MVEKKEDLKELLAEARAIYYAMLHGAITYQEAKTKTHPILIRINFSIEKLTRNYNVKPKYITFRDLGRNL